MWPQKSSKRHQQIGSGPPPMPNTKLSPFLCKWVPPWTRKTRCNRCMFLFSSFSSSFLLPLSVYYALHPETADAIDNIVRTNFDIKMLAKNTGNRGYYGAGIYFAEQSLGAIFYARGCRMLLCMLLTGNEHQCPGLMMGARLVKGCDSHIAPNRAETVIFDDAQILPCYILTFEIRRWRIIDDW